MPRKRHSTLESSPSAGEHSNSCMASQGELLQQEIQQPPLQPPPTHSTCLTYPQASQISRQASRPSSQTFWQCPQSSRQQSGEGSCIITLQSFHNLDMYMSALTTEDIIMGISSSPRRSQGGAYAIPPASSSAFGPE